MIACCDPRVIRPLYIEPPSAFVRRVVVHPRTPSVITDLAHKPVVTGGEAAAEEGDGGRAGACHPPDAKPASSQGVASRAGLGERVLEDAHRGHGDGLPGAGRFEDRSEEEGA